MSTSPVAEKLQGAYVPSGKTVPSGVLVQVEERRGLRICTAITSGRKPRHGRAPERRACPSRGQECSQLSLRPSAAAATSGYLSSSQGRDLAGEDAERPPLVAVCPVIRSRQSEPGVDDRGRRRSSSERRGGPPTLLTTHQA